MINASQPPAAGTERAYTLDCPIQDYHDELEHDSNTSMRMFEDPDGGEELYLHTRITKRYPPKKPTHDMLMGNVKHTASLEPDRFEKLAVIIPKEVLTKAGAKDGKAYEAWLAEQAGKFPLKQAEADAIRWTVEAIWDDPKAADLLRSCSVFEHSIFWTDALGNKLKTRPDGIDELAANVIDMKFTCHPGPKFWRSVEDLGYHRSAALIQDGCEVWYGPRPVIHYIAVRNEPAYSVFVWKLPEPLIAQGRRENAATLNKLRACREGRRPWKPEGFGTVRELEVPEHVYKYELSEGYA